MMRNFSKSIGVVLVSMLILAPELSAQPTVYIVRHAEKLDSWPGGPASPYQPLNEDGVKRAAALAGFFDSKPLKAIFSSSTTRTLHTAFPVSQKQGVPITLHRGCQDTTAIAGFLDEMSEKYDANDAVLVVTHSNMIPYFLIKAGLDRDCWKEMGLSQSSPVDWILISGYGNIWKMKLDGPTRRCGDFEKETY